MIEDVLSLSKIDIYVTTDCSQLIRDKFGENSRIKIKELNRDDLKVRLPIGPNKGADDFNFNMRYLCLDHVKELENSLIIFTDCDNSFDWWDESEIKNFYEKMVSDGFDFFGPRTDYKVRNLLNTFNTNCLSKINQSEYDYANCTVFWHKLYNYDMIDFDKKTIKDFENHGWAGAGLPSEYLLIFINKDGKLKKMVDNWKWFHDYLVNKDFTYGTWAEGFEIGVSAYLAGFKDFDISYSHPIWSKVFTPNGYKTGPRGGIIHATEK